MAFTNSSIVQPPIPSLGCGEMFGTRNRPNGVSSCKPPPSRNLSSPFARRPSTGVAWQDAQPPAQNMRSPATASGSCTGRSLWPSEFGLVSQVAVNTSAAMTPTSKLVFFNPIAVVAVLAGAEYGSDNRFGRIQRLRIGIDGSTDRIAPFLDGRRKSVRVFPYCRCSLATFAAFGHEVAELLRGFCERCQRSLQSIGIELFLALEHRPNRFCRIANAFHHFVSLAGRVVAGNGDGRCRNCQCQKEVSQR